LIWTTRKFAILLGIALTVVLWPSIFGGKVLLPLDIMTHCPPFSPADDAPIHNELIGDMLLENFAWKTFQRECVYRGEWPLWTPYSFCGHPIYTTGQTSTFYPFNAIFLTLPIPQAYVVFTWLHLFAGGLFAYGFFRRVGVGDFGASVGGLLFAMCAYFAVRFIWPMLLGSAIWLPLMLWWIDVMAEPRAKRSLIAGIPAGALLFAMPILSGFFEIAFYVFAACGLYTLVLGARLLRRESLRAGAVFFGKVGAVTVMAAVLSAPQLLPFFEVMDRNVRSGELSYQDAIKNGLEWQESLTFISPDALGNPSRHRRLDIESRECKPIRTPSGQDFHYFGPKNYVESTNYLGLLPLAFAALGVVAPGRRRLYFWILLIVSLALAFATPLYWVFYHFVPGTDQVRTPFRWTMLTMFACAYLAAIGADYWRARLSAPVQRLTQVIAAGKAAAMLIVAVIVLALFFYPQVPAGLAQRIISAEPRAAATFADPMELAGLLWLNAARLAVFTAITVLIVSLAYWRSWGPRAVGVFSTLALLFIAFDLGQATYRFNTHADPGLLEQVPPIVRYLSEESDKDIFRMGRFGWQRMFSPNLPTLFGIQDYGGYDSIILTDYARYLEAIEPLKQLPYNIISTCEQKSSLDSPLYRLLGIRYLISVKPLDHPDYEPVDIPGTLRLSRVKPDREVPRAYLVAAVQAVRDLDDAIESLKSGRLDGIQTAAVECSPEHASQLVAPDADEPGRAGIAEYRATRVRVQTSATGRQLLVLGDMYYPGWRAYVDGQPADIIRTNGIFRGVSVPAGEHTVEFRFEPAPLRLGFGMALACLAGLVILQAFLWSQRLRGRRPAAPAGLN